MSLSVTTPGTKGDTRQQWRRNFTFDGNPVPAAEGEKTAHLEEALAAHKQPTEDVEIETTEGKTKSPP